MFKAVPFDSSQENNQDISDEQEIKMDLVGKVHQAPNKELFQVDPTSADYAQIQYEIRSTLVGAREFAREKPKLWRLQQKMKD